MALADVLRERVSRRGRTAEVACGLLGTVTVEALPPRECAALGMRDGGRALLYAACRDLQTAGETLRREGRLFTPAEVTAYVSDEEAAAAARTVLALSGVTADGDGPSTKSAEVRHEDVQNSGAYLAVEAPSEEEIRLDGVQENTVQKAEVRLADVRKKAVQKAEIRLEDVRKPDGTAADGQVSHEFFGGDGSDRTDPILGGVSDFAPLNLALSEENDRFSAPLELSGNTEEVSGRGSNLHESESEVEKTVHETKSDLTAEKRGGLHESKSEVRETMHEMKSESAAARREGLHENRSEAREMVHETKSELTAARQEGLHESKSEVEETMHETKSESAAERRQDLHENKSEVGETVHETKSESVERFAEGLLEGLRRAAAVR